MEYTVKELEKWRREIDVNLPAEKITPKLDDMYRRYQQSLKLEGFRKGKIPIGLVKKMYGKKIEADVFDSFVQEAFKEIFNDKEFHILSSPQAMNMKYDPKEGLSFTLYFDVQPEFTVEKYKGIEVEKEVYQVTSEDVDEYLESLRQQNAMVYTMEGEAQAGHFLTVDLQKLDRTGVPIVGQKADDRVIELQNDEDVLTRQLVGVKAGAERKISIPIQSEGAKVEQNKLQEREEFYFVRVKSVSERRVPELDDEFAKDLGDFETLQELENQVEKQLQAEAQYASNRKFQRAITDEVVKDTELDVPQSMVNRYLDAVVEEVKEKRHVKKGDEEKIREESRSEAIRNIKWWLIRDKLAEQENLVITDSELDQALNQLRASGKEGQARARRCEQKEEELNRFSGDLLEQKVINFIIQNAKITERTVKREKASKIAI